MTPDQMKAARKLLGWSITRLSAHSDTSIHAVTIFEQTGRVAFLGYAGRTIPFDTLIAIRTVLEEAGIEFIDGDMSGVRLWKPADDE